MATRHSETSIESTRSSSLRLTAGLVVALALSGSGCLRVTEVELYEQHLNPKFRLDLNALSAAQMAQPVTELVYGPYRIQSDELISTLYPNSMSRRLTANLPQSRCLWLGDAGMHGGDWMDLSWEVIAVYAEPDEEIPAYVHPEGGKTGLCDMADPVSRVPIYAWSIDDFESVEVLVNGQPVTIYRQGDVISGSVFLADSERKAEDKLYRSEPFQLTGGGFKEMTHSHPPYQRGRPDSHGPCAPDAFTLPTDNINVKHNLDNPAQSLFSCPSYEESVSACGMRCLYKPVGDTRLENISLGERAEPAHDWKSAAMLMVPPTGRTIARPMTRLDSSGLYQWQVAVETAPGNPSLQRWEENFTPHVQIKRASLFYLDAQGGEHAVTQFDNESLSAAASGQVILDCHSDASGSFPIGDSSLNPHPCGTVRALNPAYDIEQLSDIPGELLQAPLSWQVRLPELAGAQSADTRVFIEFDLEVVMAPAALSFDAGSAEFEPAEAGGKTQVTRRLTNVGWQPVRIDQITIADNYEGGRYSSDRAAFSHRVPYQPQWLPLNVGMSEKTSSGKGLRLEVLQSVHDKTTPSFATVIAPFFEILEADGSPTILRPANLDGQTLNRLGEEITFDGSVGFYQNGSVDFFKQARAQLLNSEARLALGRTLYRDRQLPFVLAPGESQDILLSFAPGSIGDKTARLEVAGSVIGAGDSLTVKLPLFGAALVSAMPQALPGSVHLPNYRPNFSTGERRMVTTQPFLLINNGQTDLTWSQASIHGSHRIYFKLNQLPTTTQRIAPGASGSFVIEYLPPSCGAPVLMGPQDARLEFTTNAGVVSVPLQADLTICSP